MLSRAKIDCVVGAVDAAVEQVYCRFCSRDNTRHQYTETLYFYLKMRKNALGGRAPPGPVGGGGATPPAPVAGLKEEVGRKEGYERKKGRREGKRRGREERGMISQCLKCLDG